MARACKSLIHRPDIVDDFFDLVDVINGDHICLELKHALERCLRSFDLGTEQRLFFYVHGDEEICVGENGCHAVKTCEGAICFREEVMKFVIEMDRGIRGQGFRDICLVSSFLAYRDSHPAFSS